ncbi:GntR family transcriptional regulator [Acuticoccus mangrovi]|uniref:GntR family transcriptional regulator n=1 Tax=Acuticoccus mangrovi TaxID=2796142 RepID=A0A934IPF8_9HYPH|nr:GntR family transcriptional regulator [Acuticoccus mangrovi]MBJ3777632.1 GntR family transcriptional regulator [Acuticoccus mangrovi]
MSSREEVKANWRPTISTAPLYLQVAHHLDTQISEGRYPVGSLLPTENDLASDLSVSRQTVRQAIAVLRSGGRLSARKGVGTKVEANITESRRKFVAASRAELFEFARETELFIEEREEIGARGKFAAELGCRPGRRFLRLAGTRFPADEKTPLSYDQVYIDARYSAAVKDIDSARTAIFSLIEKQSGEKIEEIFQEIRPTVLHGEIAAKLAVDDGELAMQITRRYFGSGRRPLEYSVQIFPASRFTYTTTLRAEA